MPSPFYHIIVSRKHTTFVPSKNSILMNSIAIDY